MKSVFQFFRHSKAKNFNLGDDTPDFFVSQPPHTVIRHKGSDFFNKVIGTS